MLVIQLCLRDMSVSVCCVFMKHKQDWFCVLCKHTLLQDSIVTPTCTLKKLKVFELAHILTKVYEHTRDFFEI